MAKVIHCPCGFDVKGADDDELWAEAQKHVQDAHPDMVGKVNREELLSSAEEV